MRLEEQACTRASPSLRAVLLLEMADEHRQQTAWTWRWKSCTTSLHSGRSSVTSSASNTRDAALELLDR